MLRWGERGGGGAARPPGTPHFLFSLRDRGLLLILTGETEASQPSQQMGQQDPAGTPFPGSSPAAWLHPAHWASPPPLAAPKLTFISTDSLSFSRLTILTATFWHVTQ